MKSKTLNKKLTLNKSTIAHLGNSVMADAKGGQPTTGLTTYCTSWRTDCETHEWVSCEESAMYCTFGECTQLVC